MSSVSLPIAVLGIGVPVLAPESTVQSQGGWPTTTSSHAGAPFLFCYVCDKVTSVNPGARCTGRSGLGTVAEGQDAWRFPSMG